MRGLTSGPESASRVADEDEGELRPPPPARADRGPSPACRPVANGSAGFFVSGLTSVQATERLAQHGPNRLPQAVEVGWADALASRLRHPLVLLLLAASALAALTGDVAEFAVIVSIVTSSLALDLWQARRAGATVQALRRRLALRCRAWRDGALLEMAAEDLVPGDLVALRAGDRVPADGLLIEAHDLFLDQSLLTGESHPVERHAVSAAGLPADAQPLAPTLCRVYAGTVVVSGQARMEVQATGTTTALGELAQAVQRPAGPSAFESATQRFALGVLRLSLLLVVGVLAVHVAAERPVLESLLFATALAVGLTPELLPMVVTVTLSQGARQLARTRVVVRRLSAVHDLGAMDLLCADKTGTLTLGEVGLERWVDAHGQPSERVLALAGLNSVFETGIHSPLDAAITARAGRQTEGWRKLDEVPFGFERRRVSVLLARDAQRQLIVKGAVREVLALCARAEAGGATEPLDAAGTAALQARVAALEDVGLRVLAVAWRDVGPDHDHARVDDEQDMTLAGLLAFADPPRPDAAALIAGLARHRVGLRIVTGDSERVALHLCGQIGLRVRGVLTGEEIDRLTDRALRARVGRTTLFCRMNPTQKQRIVQALRARGHTVGFLGDGANDAPPLHAAHVGLTVAGAADAAREAADILLLEPGLGVVLEGVREGRRTVANLLKYLVTATSSNSGNMVSLALASTLLPFLPLLPRQVLLNNLLYDVSQATLTLDRVAERDLRRPRRLDLRALLRFMAVFALLSSAFDALTLAVLWQSLGLDEAAVRTGWFIESLASQALVIAVLRTRETPWADPPAWPVSAACLGVAGTAVALPYSGWGEVFGFVPLPPTALTALGAIVLGYLVAARACMAWLFSRRGWQAGGVRRARRNHPGLPLPPARAARGVQSGPPSTSAEPPRRLPPAES